MSLSVLALKMILKLATLSWIYQPTLSEASKVTGNFTGMHLTYTLPSHQSLRSHLLLLGNKYAL